jgi:ankyrin repeat protein
MTPLHCVCISGYSSIVEIIVNQKNVNVKDEDGNTPLHIACLHNHPKVVNVLVTKGADILAVDYRGEVISSTLFMLLRLNVLCRRQDALAFISQQYWVIRQSSTRSLPTQ